MQITAQRMHTCEFNFGKPGIDTWQVGHVQFKLLPLFVQKCFFCLIRLHLDMRSLLCEQGTGLVIFCNRLRVWYFRSFYSIWANFLNSWYSLYLSFNAVISFINNIQDLSLFRDGTLMKLTVFLWHILQGKGACLLRGLCKWLTKEKRTHVYRSNKGQVTCRFRKLSCWYVSQLDGCCLCSWIRLRIWLHLGTFWTSFRVKFTPIKPAGNESITIRENVHLM